MNGMFGKIIFPLNKLQKSSFLYVGTGTTTQNKHDNQLSKVYMKTHIVFWHRTNIMERQQHTADSNLK